MKGKNVQVIISYDWERNVLVVAKSRALSHFSQPGSKLVH